MQGWGGLRRWGYGVWSALGVGLLAGAMEMVWISNDTRLPLTFVEFMTLGVANSLVMGVLALLAGAMLGPLALWLGRGARPSTGLAHHLSGVGVVAVAFYLWPIAWSRYQQGLVGPGLVLAVLPAAFYGVVYFNARYFLRRVERGERVTVPWNAAAAVGALALVAISAAVAAGRFTGGGAIAGDPSALVITLSGLGRSHTGFGGAESWIPLTEEHPWVLMNDAVSPVPVARPAAASLLTGLHPLRHRILRDTAVLPPRFPTLAGALAEEGWATAAFVSRAPFASASGIAQGFFTYDDAFFGAIPGLEGTQWARRLRWQPRGRDAARTEARFMGWLSAQDARPFFAWVQLDAGDRDAAARADQAVHCILAALEDRGRLANTLVVVVGDHGSASASPLDDALLRVPMYVSRMGEGPWVEAVEAQVSLVDVGPTILEMMGLDPIKEIDGASTVGYLRGTATHTTWVTLLGEDTQIGLRTHEFKYIQRLDDAGEQLFRWPEDPAMQRDVASDYPETVHAARELLSREKAIFSGLRSELERGP